MMKLRKIIKVMAGIERKIRCRSKCLKQSRENSKQYPTKEILHLASACPAHLSLLYRINGVRALVYDIHIRVSIASGGGKIAGIGCHVYVQQEP